MQHFTKLLVWKRSHQPVLAIDSASVGFPRAELFGLTSQLRRAALSPAASRYLKEVSACEPPLHEVLSTMQVFQFFVYLAVGC